jgi:tetratricopeptide (TPR) repeat protein
MPYEPVPLPTWAGRCALTLTLVLAAGCAALSAGPSTPDASSIPRLEERLARDSANPAVLVSLAVAYRSAERTADGQPLLERALELAPDSPAALFYLGLLHEERGDHASAKALYSRYLKVSRSSRLAAMVDSRIRWLDHFELLENVRQTAARESELAQAPPAPNTVAVYPFLYAGADADLAPLSLALADMLTTDLSISSQLSVLERARVHLLLNEIDLAEQGRVDPASAARGGRLLGAGQIVQGRIDGDQAALSLQAAVVAVTGAAAPSRPISERDAAQRIFEMQKRIADGIFQNLGIELTPAEREQLNRRPTESLQALLAYGRGLQALDNGQFSEAARFFSDAVAIDPQFSEARDRAGESAAAAAGMLLSASALAQAGAEELPSVPIDAGSALGEVQALVPEASGRNAVSEALGDDGFGRRVLIDIILRRP